MGTLHLWVLFSVIFSMFLWRFAIPNRKNAAITVGNLTLPLLLLAALVLRLLLASSSSGFGADISCFAAWSDRMATIGPSGFYSPDYFSDYPPLYLYCLGLIGKVAKLLSLQTFSPVHLILLKLPAILSDLGIGYFLYRAGRKHIGMLSGIALASLYLFQPVVIMNSCLWGQIDSVFTLLLMIVCFFLEREQLMPAFLFYGAGVLLKPQMLIFAPLIIASVLKYSFDGGFSSRRFFRAACYGILSILVTFLAASPFGLEKVLLQYTDTLTSYPYASVNAYNYWAALGYNWRGQETLLMGIPCSMWGTVAIVFATGFSFLVLYHFRTVSSKYSLMGAFLIITVFTFSVRMHERYLFPMIALLLLSFPGLAARQLCNDVDSGSSRKYVTLTFSLRNLFPVIFTIFTCLHFYNTGHVLYYYNPSSYSADAPILRLSGMGMTITALVFYGLLFHLHQKTEGITVSDKEYKAAISRKELRITAQQTRMTKTDLLLLLCTTILYSCFALYDIGDRQAPETVYEMNAGDSVSLLFDSPVSSVSWYIAPEHDRGFTAHCVDAEDGQENEFYLSMDNVFTWNTQSLPSESTSLSLTLNSSKASIIELVFTSADGSVVTPSNASLYPELFDENSLFPERFTFRNSMYFDEIYHARTAYEFLHDMRSYENTHPPLGKILISLGVLLFGMNTFGWRIVGIITGILMLPMIYLFAKKLTGNTPCAALTCWIFAFDFMHFAQTRIATIDVYIVFFIICMYYFLYRALSTDYYGPLKNLLIPLGLSGLSMGLGIASKWTGVYAGAGMGLLFFATLGYEFRRSRKTSGKKNNRSASGSADLTMQFKTRTTTLILYCLIFFVAVPALIYLLSYLPFRDGTGNGLLARLIKNQQDMLSYHSNLNATHYFASPFYEWPLIIRPIWYYSGIVSSTVREGISSFGNPLVWWAGIPAFCHMLYLIITRRDRRAIFLVTGYLAQYLPWFFVSRITFIYHYFPSVVFIVLMTGYSFRHLLEGASRKKTLLCTSLYALAVFGLFLLFYPVISGQPVESAFVKTYLKWFETWVLIAG